MDIESARASTAEVYSGDAAELDYITEELLTEYEGATEYGDDEATFDADDAEHAAAEVAAAEGATEGAGPRDWYHKYGSRVVFVQDLSRPNFIGKLFFTNGSPNRPNDPCGTAYRRVFWCHVRPSWQAFRNCGNYTGMQIIAY